MSLMSLPSHHSSYFSQFWPDLIWDCLSAAYYCWFLFIFIPSISITLCMAIIQPHLAHLVAYICIACPSLTHTRRRYSRGTDFDSDYVSTSSLLHPPCIHQPPHPHHCRCWSVCGDLPPVARVSGACTKHARHRRRRHQRTINMHAHAVAFTPS